MKVAVGALSEAAGRELTPDVLEVSGLDASQSRRRFFRLRDRALRDALDA